MTEEEIIKGCIREDRRSQNELYRKYFPLMSSIALRYSKDEGEAMHKLNGGFLKILQNLHRYNNQYALATFIRNVLINHMIDAHRREKKYMSVIQLVDYQEYESSVFNEGELKLDADSLLDLLHSLPEVMRNVFNLFAIDGYKHLEISEMLGISEGTSKWHVSEARKRLKLELENLVNMEKKRNKLA